MNKRHAILAVGVLATSLVVGLRAPAESTMAPHIVRWLARGSSNYFVVWSDGQIDHQTYDAKDCLPLVYTVILSATGRLSDVIDANSNGGGMIVEYDDGLIEYITGLPANPKRCTISEPTP